MALAVSAASDCSRSMTLSALSGTMPNACRMGSTISRCCPVTHTWQWIDAAFLSAVTTGLILIASGRVPMITVTVYMLFVLDSALRRIRGVDRTRPCVAIDVAGQELGGRMRFRELSKQARHGVGQRPLDEQPRFRRLGDAVA